MGNPENKPNFGFWDFRIIWDFLEDCKGRKGSKSSKKNPNNEKILNLGVFRCHPITDRKIHTSTVLTD